MQNFVFFLEKKNICFYIYFDGPGQMIASDVKFLNHTGCNRCGSSDAKALYSDGSTFCFSCRTHTNGTVSGYVLKAKAQEEGDKIIVPPDDINFEYTSECLAWVHQYDLLANDLIKQRVFWSNRFNQLLFIYQSFEKAAIGLIQGRNFTDGRVKYFNMGDVNKVLPIYNYSEGQTANSIVLVEDAISAIKIASNVWVDACPILGSSLSYDKMVRIANLGYKHIYVWLDHDKYRESLAIVQRMQLLGPDASVVTSDLDPKCYTIDVIAHRLDLV